MNNGKRECLKCKAKEKYRGMFEIQKCGDKTSSGEISPDIRTHASPKVGQDQVSGGVSVPLLACRTRQLIRGVVHVNCGICINKWWRLLKIVLDWSRSEFTFKNYFILPNIIGFLIAFVGRLTGYAYSSGNLI